MAKSKEIDLTKEDISKEIFKDIEKINYVQITLKEKYNLKISFKGNCLFPIVYLIPYEVSKSFELLDNGHKILVNTI